MSEAFTPKQLEYKTGGPPVREILYTADMLRDEFDVQGRTNVGRSQHPASRDTRTSLYSAGSGRKPGATKKARFYGWKKRGRTLVKDLTTAVRPRW